MNDNILQQPFQIQYASRSLHIHPTSSLHPYHLVHASIPMTTYQGHFCYPNVNHVATYHFKILQCFLELAESHIGRSTTIVCLGRVLSEYTFTIEWLQLLLYLGECRIDLESFLSVPDRLQNEKTCCNTRVKDHLRNGIAVVLQFDMTESAIGKVGCNGWVEFNSCCILFDRFVESFLCLNKVSSCFFYIRNRIDLRPKRTLASALIWSALSLFSSEVIGGERTLRSGA